MRALGAALWCVAAAARSAGALEIEFFDVGSTPMPAARMAAFRSAAELWERELVDPITVRINVGFEDFAAAKLGVTRVQRTTFDYRDVRAALELGATSFREADAIGDLPLSGLPLVDARGLRQDNRVTLATANAKALGLATGLDPFYGQPLAHSADAQIEFNLKLAGDFDYDPSDGVDGQKLDFVGLAAREIGHALGFNSMVDLQDLPGNRPFDIHPSTLDFWRFDIASLPHNLRTERRRLTSGPAEFFDRRLDRELSWGRHLIDPACDATNGACPADYWRDPLDGVMTPSMPYGEAVRMVDADVGALDAIGYERVPVFNPRRAVPLERMVVGWFKPADDAPCLGCELPEFPGDEFDDFAPPPEFSELPREVANVDFNLGVRIGLDLDVDGLRNRSGIGFASFRGEIANREQFNYSPGPDVPGEQNLLPAVQYPETLPASIMEFFFRSDTTAGDPFTFIAELGEEGAPFDPTLGEFGGYRITGFVDGAGDGAIDHDGVMTFILAADGPGDPDGGAMNIYQMIPDALDNNFTSNDEDAFDFGPFVPGDTYPFDGKVDLEDLNNVRNNFGEEGEFGTPGDTFRFDGVVDLSDLNEVRNNFGAGVAESNAIPEPASIALSAVMALAALTAVAKRSAPPLLHRKRNTEN